MAPCRFFALGICTYGAYCKNSHEAPTDNDATAWFPKASTTDIDNRLAAAAPISAVRLCWFFTQGKCTYGASCHKSHDLATALDTSPLPLETSAPYSTETLARPETTGITRPLRRSLKADAPPFNSSSPASHNFKPIGTQQARHPITCIYFGKGFCKNGVECDFRHESPALVPGLKPTGQENLSGGTLEASLNSLSVSEVPSKEIHGAAVRFAAGAKIATIKLASDFSTIQISGLGVGAGADDVQEILLRLGSDALNAMITVKQLGRMGAVAEVKVEDPTFATQITEKFQSNQHEELYFKLMVKPMIGSTPTGTLGNRLQLSTVSCTWYQASRAAWLVFPSRHEAEKAKGILESRKILGRSPDLSFQGSSFTSSRSTLQVGNLASGTTKAQLNASLRDARPMKITMGVPSHDLPNDSAASIIREMLDTVGALESFEWMVADGSNKMKALAVFNHRDSAVEAVRKLNNAKISELGRSKLFLDQVVSVKYNILTAIVNALKNEIDQLRDEIWTKSRSSLRPYPQNDPLKPFTTIRLFGKSHKNIADAKVSLETLLAGDVVMHDDLVLWDPFFSNDNCLLYLNDLGEKHQCYIHRNARESRLVIHSSSETSRTTIQHILVEKVNTLKTHSHKIELTPELLEKAIRGGMRSLKEKFGNAAKLDVSHRAISITGSIADVHEARAILAAGRNLQASKADDRDTTDCVVCWTEAEDPLNMSCGHAYCKDCFVAQVSTNDVALPVICAEERCDYNFEMKELQGMLPFATFENLLQASFESFIRMHPKDFQFCPTPDCPRIYRVTDSGSVVLCTHCLMSICTTCNVISHDGMSCEEYKDLSTENTKAFERYKKETDTRNCPGCKVGIQKNEGCNHMTCINCKAHICWFCMEFFETSAECYDHLQAVHGNFGV